MPDAGLRKIFRDHIRKAHWQSIESPMTGGGTPDANYCFEWGIEGWIEFKRTLGWAIKFDKEALQVAWLDRRARMGGRVWIGIRQMHAASPRRASCDTLWLFHGRSARALKDHGLKATGCLSYSFPYGPERWDWEKIEWVLRQS